MFQFRLVVKTALKLLLVFVEYTESNTQHLIKAVNTVDKKRRKWAVKNHSVKVNEYIFRESKFKQLCHFHFCFSFLVISDKNLLF